MQKYGRLLEYIYFDESEHNNVQWTVLINVKKNIKQETVYRQPHLIEKTMYTGDKQSSKIVINEKTGYYYENQKNKIIKIKNMNDNQFVKVVLSEPFIGFSQIPKNNLIISPKLEQKIIPDDSICPICIHSFTDDRSVTSLNNCDHLHHSDCFKCYNKFTCTICWNDTRLIP